MNEPAQASSSKYILVIDLGSSGIKTVLVSDSGEVVANAYEPVETQYLENEGAEQDPHHWWNGTLKAAKETVQKSNISPDQIVGIACDSQWAVVVPVNEQAEPVMNAVHWFDQRGAPYNKKVISGFPSIQGYGALKLLKWLRLTGLAPVHSGVDSLGHILFIKNERPDVYARTHKFLEPMDYITARLTGRITGTQQSVMAMMVVSNRKWGEVAYNNTLLKLAGLDKDKLPDLLPNDAVIGPVLPSVARELGVNPDTPVTAGTNDTQAIAIGAGLGNIYEAAINIGTSLNMITHVPFKKTDIFHMITSFPSSFKDRYLMLCEQGLGGRCLEHFLKYIVCPDDDFKFGSMPEDAYDRLSGMADEVPAGSGGVIFLPWLNGSLAPSESATARGGFMNMSLSTTRSHLTRAVMEGVAFNSRRAFGPAQKFIKAKIGHLRLAGGGAISDVWTQIYADIVQVPIHQVDDTMNTTSRGAGLTGLVMLGHLKLEDVPSLVKVKKIFEPNPDNFEVYDKMFAQFEVLFNKNQSVFKALNS
jgi:xylulokinase